VPGGEGSERIIGSKRQPHAGRNELKTQTNAERKSIKDKGHRGETNAKAVTERKATTVKPGIFKGRVEKRKMEKSFAFCPAGVEKEWKNSGPRGKTQTSTTEEG